MRDSERTYARLYERVHRRAVHDFVVEAVRASGGRILFSSGPSTAPLFVACEDPKGVRVGFAAYVFLANKVETRNRPVDEHRAQIRYGDVNDAAWRRQDHRLGVDPTGLDLTSVLVAHPRAGILMSLDPSAYDPLPIGNSVYFDEPDVAETASTGWHVWERIIRSGSVRTREIGLETVVGFAPDRFFDYLAVERQAQTLRLDQTLRFVVAQRAAARRPGSALHELEAAFDLTAREVLDLIKDNRRLAMAVRGGVAEEHLGRELRADATVARAWPGREEGPPDWWVEMADGSEVRVECKNASPKPYADGSSKVEVQKTRASRGDSSSRYYGPDAFDVVAACLYGSTGRWTFRYCRVELLTPHPEHEGKVAPVQRVLDSWPTTLARALAQ